MQKKQNITIGVLAMLAVTLTIAHLFVPQAAQAEAVKDRDYQVVTARVTSGGDGLYIHDVKTGQIAIFTYDPSARGLKARQVRLIADAFNVPRP